MYQVVLVHRLATSLQSVSCFLPASTIQNFWHIMGKHGMDCEPGHQPQKAFLQEKCILIAPKLNF